MGDLAFGMSFGRTGFKVNFSNGRERVGRPARRRNGNFTGVKFTKTSTTITLEDRKNYRPKLDQLYKIVSWEIL